MTAHTAGPSAFGDPSAIRCERAVAELRAGRPVLLDGGPLGRRAFVAVEAAATAVVDALAASADGAAWLFVTAPRARSLGIDAPGGARLPLADTDPATLAAIAWQRDAVAPAGWHGGDAVDAAAAEVARLGLLLPALVVVPVVAGDDRFDDCAALTLDDLREGAPRAARDIEIVARTPVPLREGGDALFTVFRGGVAQRDQVAVPIGHPDTTAPVPVRVHSSCLTGDLFGSLKCDCGDQLRRALRALRDLGGGVLLYLDQEGRGTGIAAKMRAYGYQHDGLDTIDADAQLGFGADERRYDMAAAMLQALGIDAVRLLSNNPSKAERLRAAGIEVVERLPLAGAVTAENEGYLRTKAARAGHAIDVDAMIRALR